MTPRVWMRVLSCIAAVALAPQMAVAEEGAPRYGGVTPGTAASDPPPARRGAWTNLSWLGFLPEEDGRARVFVRVGRRVQLDQVIVDGALWVMLDRVRPAMRNANRPLDVRFFDTDLATIRAHRIARRAARGDRPAQPDGTKVVVTFQDPSRAREAHVSTVRDEDGHHYLYLDFEPQGSPAPGD